MRGISFVYSLLRPLTLVGLVFLFGDNLRANEVLVRRVGSMNGTVEGDLRVLATEALVLNGAARVDGRLVLSGSPRVRINGAGQIGRQGDELGNALPEGWTVTLNGRVWVQELVTRGRAVKMPSIAAPSRTTGARDVVLSRPTDEVGNFATVRNLTLNGAAGEHAVPGGSYGRLTVNGRGAVLLGERGGLSPTKYTFQRLVLNGAGELRVQGPVHITLEEGAVVQGISGNTAHPEWLRVDIAKGGLTLNGQARLFGEVIAPAGTVILNGGSELAGSVVADRLILNGGARVRVVTLERNKPPIVHLRSPMPDTHFVAPATVELVADAHDPDGRITRVDFMQGGMLLARDEVAPFEYSWNGLLAGEYAVSARALDDAGADSESLVHRFIVAQNQLPRAELVSPTDGERFYYPGLVRFQADASDPEGAIDRVEFFVNDESIGETTEPPYTLNWNIAAPGSYSASARVIDQHGAGVDSESREFYAIATVPDFSRFSLAEGFLPGLLDGQLGWSGTGNALIESDEETGEAYVALAIGEERASMSRNVVVLDAGAVVFVDLTVRATAAPDATSSTQILFDGVELFFQERHGTGELLVFDPSSGAGERVATGVEFPLAEGWVSERPLRITVRIHREAGVWDLYMEGVMVRASIPFGSPRPMRLAAAADPTLREFTFRVLGPTFEHGAATVVSGLYIGWENPIASDQDFDGIDDGYEIQNGMSLDREDRLEDVDGDGLANIDEYVRGSAAGLADTDGDGLGDAWEVASGLDPRAAGPPGQDSDADGLSDADEAVLGTAPNLNDSDRDGISDGWEQAHGLDPLDPSDAHLDADGDGFGNYSEFRQNTNPHDPLDGHELVIKPLLTASGRLLPGGRFKVRISRSDGQPLQRASVTLRILDDINYLTDGIHRFQEISLETDESGIAEIGITAGDPPPGDDEGGSA